MSPATLSYYKQYIEGIEPCLITLPESVDRDRAPLSESIVLPVPEPGYAKDGDLLVTLASAWGLLLSFYSGNLEVCFGVQDRRTTHLSTTLCRMNADPASKIEACLAKMQFDLQMGGNTACKTMRDVMTAAGLDGTDRLCNTALLAYDFEPSESCFDSSEYDIMVYLKDVTTVGLRYRPTFISRETAEHLANALCRAFSDIANAKSGFLGGIQVLSQEQLDKMRLWNKRPSTEAHGLVHQTFEKQVHENPHAQAVWSWDGSWTYAELERLSSRLAIRLQSLGIGPEVPVLLCFEKSKWHVLASLAVLKAGGVCASVDPAHPVDRLRTIAQTAKATVSLCTDHKAEEMRSVVDYVMPLSSDTMETLVESAGETTFTCSNVAPTNAAFIVFTSGSTGKPKGIVQQHGAFCWASHQFRQLIGTRPGRRVLQFAAYTFDISIVDTFITLMYGACLCIPSEHDRVNNLPGYVNSAGVNQACITPTVARTFLPEETPGLSVLCLAGEAVTKDNIASWSDKLELLNAYGPAEVSVAVLCRTNMKPDTHPADTGRPIGGGCWIVSKHSTEQLVPIGAIGELLVEGPHVARGYLHDTKKTTTSFVKSPMWFNKMNGHDDTHRFYRTGDLVRYQPDGSLFFLGRADSQVKVRGQRVELGEVEHTIYESRLASTAIVLYPTHGVLSKNLVAIVSFPGLSAAETTIRGVIRTLHKDLRSEAQRLTALLKKYLGSILPQYMIPSIWICLPSMPSTNSGKLDRKALQDWIMEMDKDVARNDSDLESEDESETTLETAAQEHVAKALSWVLNIPFEKIRSTDSFLRLGGDSVSAMAVVSRCRHDGNITISVQDLLQADILRDVAERAKDAIAVESVFDLGAELDAPFSLTPIQEMFLAATSRMEYSQSFLLKMNSKVSGQKLQEAFDTLVGRHSMLRARFQRDINANSWKQQVTPFDRKAYSLNFYGSTTLEHVYQVNSKTRSTLDICTGPVFAANIFHDEIGTNRICFLTAHHMIIDLVSWRIILRDLEELLLSPDVGAKPSVHPLSFETWARLQREFVNRLPTSVSAPNTESQSPNFRYWGMENTLSTFDCLDTLKFELSSDHTAALLGPANATLSTEPADILLGITMHAFAATFRDRTMPAFFTESHGRESWHSSIDPSETIGWFTTMYPILTTNKSPKDVMDTISDVKDARRKIADKGFAWFSSQFLNSDYNESPVRQGAVEIIFNYFGMYQQLEREGSLFTPINTIEMQPTEEGGAGTARMSLLEVDIAVYHGRLQFSLLFDRKMRHQDRLLAFMQQAQYFFEEAARILPERQRKLTASDVPLLNIGCTQLDELMTTVITKAGFSAADVQSMYPCSSMQEDILNSQAKDLGYYNTRLVWRADGKTTSSINSLRLDNAWRQLCKRHAILRSTFLPNPWIPGKWFQIAARATLPAVEHIDGPLQTVEHVCRAIADDATPNWNVPRPRHRLKIWPTLEGTIICQIDISHVLIDGTATETIMRDWLACYNDSVLQQASAYERYIEFLQSQPRHRELEYWMGYAQDMPTTILRTHNLDALQPLRTNHIMDIPVARLRQCCETYQTTPACVFRAAWALALSRYGDSDDVVFGYLAHGRDAPITSARTIVGPMVLTLPCWVRGTRDSSLSTILRQVQQDMVKSLSAQNVSWGEVERACRRQERPFDTLVNYRKAVDATIDLGSAITLTELWTYDPMEYTIVMEVEQSANYARICLNYWDRHLAKPALAIVQQHLEDSLSELL